MLRPPFSPGRRKTGLADPELIALCLSGDARAWDTLIERHESLIYTALRRAGLSASDADDVFQEVCLLLLNHLEQLRDNQKLAGWLISVARREAWRVHKRRRAANVAELDAPDGPRETEILVEPSQNSFLPEPALIALEEGHLVRQGLTQLATRCRDLLSLLYIEDPPVPYAEVSRRLSLPVGSIGPQRARCLQQLHKQLIRLGF